jgi:NDP-sugar pyrophosphorylase family protein
MHLIIPMSGIGKRFIEAGYKDPKPLITIENKPIIQHVVELFPGETHITFICNDKHLRETNMRNVLQNISPTCSIREVSVENRKGPVDAVYQMCDEIKDDEEIIVSYCDYGTEWDYKQFLYEIRTKNVDGAIPCYKGFHPHMLGSDNYAFVKTTNENFLTDIQEKKPFTDNKMNEYASNGTYYFRSGSIVKKYFQELMDLNMSINNEFYVSMVYKLLQRDGLSTLVFEINKMLQWGTPKDVEEYLVWSNYFLKRDSMKHTTLLDKYDTTLVLPMAGAGSRFFTVGYKDPKPLLQIEKKPMVIQAVSQLPTTSHKIFICQEEHLTTYHIGETIKEYFPESTVIGINYITEGQACTCDIALQKCEIPLDKPILISACDNGVYYDPITYQTLVDDPSVDIIIWSFSNNPTGKLYPHMYAWLDVDEFDTIKRVSIKKPFTDCENKYAIIGTMLFKKASYFKEGLELIYNDNIQTNNEFYVDNVIEPLINKGYTIKIFNVDNYLCWGTPNDYKTYEYWYDYFNKKQ